MKIVKEHLNEKFAEDSDPIQDMSIGAKKWEIIFRDYGDEEMIVKQKFNSEKEAKKWVEELGYDYQDIAIDDDGNDYWKTFYRYFNPEDKESYVGYDIIPIK